MKRALALLIALILAMPTFAFAEDNAPWPLRIAPPSPTRRQSPIP